MHVLGEMERLLSGVEQRESIFLDLGNSLTGLYRIAEDLSAQGAELVDLTSLDRLDSFMESLRMETDRLEKEFRQRSVSGVLDRITTIRNALQQLNRLAQDFRRTVRMLGMLGISTRIESARLGNEGRGFLGLADDVEKLAANIVDYSSRIVDNSSELDSVILKAMDHTLAISTIEKESSRAAFDEINKSLSRLQEVGTASASGSLEIARVAREFAERMSAMVASLQFHDIVRQQVEHVRQTAGEMVGFIRSRSADTQDSTKTASFMAWIRDASLLQARQLENGSERFVKALDELRFALGAVGTDASDLRKAADVLGTGGGSTGDNALELVRNAMVRITENMDSFRRKSGEVAGIMISVTDTIKAVVDLVREIQDVGFQIELIALNASIKAAHTGERGKALGVLASSIQTLSKEAREHTDRTTEVLETIAGVSGELNEISQGMGAEADTRAADLGLAEIMQAARDLGAQVEKRTRDIHAGCEEVVGMVSESSDHLGVGGVVESELRHAANRFRELADQASILVPKNVQYQYDEHLNVMLERYTMEAERLVHLGEEAQDGAGQESMQEDQNDWDNVELF